MFRFPSFYHRIKFEILFMIIFVHISIYELGVMNTKWFLKNSMNWNNSGETWHFKINKVFKLPVIWWKITKQKNKQMKVYLVCFTKQIL